MSLLPLEKRSKLFAGLGFIVFGLALFIPILVLHLPFLNDPDRSLSAVFILYPITLAAILLPMWFFIRFRIGRYYRALEVATGQKQRALFLFRWVNSFFLEPSDERSLGPMIDLLANEFRADHSFIAWADAWSSMIVMHGGEEKIARLDQEGWKKNWRALFSLEEGSTGKDFTCPLDGKTCAHVIYIPVMLKGEHLGLIVLGRHTTPFDPVELELLDAIQSQIAPVMFHRLQEKRFDYMRRITEAALQSSEKKLQTILDESRDLIVTANTDNKITYINKTAAKLMRKSSAELLGTNLNAFWFNQEDFAYFKKRLFKDGFVDDFELVLKIDEDSPIFGLTSATLFKSPDGAIEEFTCIVKDISEFVKNQQELYRANIALEENNAKLRETQALLVQQEKMASIGALAAGVAHEINNPLAFIKSNFGILKKHFATFRELLSSAPSNPAHNNSALSLEKRIADTEAIFAETDDGLKRIVDIVQNLRSFSRVEDKTSIGPYDINKGLKSTLAVSRNEAKHIAQINLTMGSVPVIYCNGSEINQVLLNIIVNAVQAIKQAAPDSATGQTGIVDITTGLIRDRVFCEIKDNGPGIPQEYLNKIFDPFFTTKPIGSGTGLGLSISHDIIVKKHGGSLTVRSAPGNGATFRIELPVSPPKPSS